MVDGSSWKSILVADQHGSTKEVLCLRPWSHDGWPSFRLAIYPFIILIYKPLLAHWASHVHYNLSFLTSCSHFFTGGPLVYACIVWESHESWTYRCMFLSLFFLPSFYCIPSYLIGCVLYLLLLLLLLLLFYLLLVLLHILSTPSGDPPQFITWGIVTSFPLFITRTLI